MGAVVVEVLYFTLRQWPQHWWILAWALFMGLFILLAQLAPVVLFPIFYKFEPLDNEDLRRRLVVLSERAGTRVRGVYRWKLSEKSKKANAALTGLGATRRIILADTLLDNYTPEEIEAVLAHELGHHVHRHILKSIFVQAAITLFGFWAANWTLHYAVDQHMFEELSDFANLPLLALVSVVLSFLLMPALNAYSRFNERQADRYAFESIASVEPFISSMNKLAEQNLAERTPSKWVEWFFHSHPAISRRLAAAKEWGRKQELASASLKTRRSAYCAGSRSRAASLLPYRRPRCRAESRPHKSRCHFPESAVVPAARFFRATTPATLRTGPARVCDRRRDPGA